MVGGVRRAWIARVAVERDILEMGMIGGLLVVVVFGVGGLLELGRDVSGGVG